MVNSIANESSLVFRLSEHVPEVIRQILTERGWSEYDDEDSETSEADWNLWWRTQRFRRSEHSEIEPWQRLNHFPKTDAITRKDSLVRNLRRMRCIHGSQAFNFHPLSYILPNEYTKFVSDYGKEIRQHGKRNVYWICKPSVLSRGRGIFVFQDLKDLNYDCSVVVQRYIPKPLLMSGYKFDLRIYVCVPSFHPLTIYMYQEGLVRFSTEKFNLDQLGNVFSHLTNTSINKYGPAFSIEKERVGSGCKWTLAQLRTFLSQIEELDEMVLWQKISNIITLVLATQAPYVPKSQNCFELFGFDILIDEMFKPWLLEVNFSPALNMECQTDFIVKRQMINDLIDLLNFKDCDGLRGNSEDIKSKPTSQSKFSTNSSKKNTRINRTGLYNTSPKSQKPFQSKSSQRLSSVRSPRTNEQKLRRSDSVLNKSNVSFNRSESSVSDTILPDINSTQLDASKEDKDSGISSAESYRKNLSPSSNDSTANVDKVSQSDQKGNPELKRKNSKIFRKKTTYAWMSNENRTESVNSRRSISTRNSNRPPGYKSLPQINHSHLSVPAKKHDSVTMPSIRTPRDQFNSRVPKMTESLNLESIGEDDDTAELSDRSYFLFGHKSSVRKKKTANSAPVIRSPVQYSNNYSQQTVQSARTHKSFLPKEYVSPYSSQYTSRVAKSQLEKNQWPRTRVGDFILTFPWNEATRKAGSGTSIDMKTIIKEQQKITKKLTSLDCNETIKNRRASQTLSTADALELSFELKFDYNEQNPLYFWGPKNPPLLAKVTGR